ncbi:histidinol-phosphatase [Bremerella volcania]|nr:histidinol-phosphatase [Bremerella volcania]
MSMNNSHSDLEKRLETARRLARVAGKSTLEHFQRADLSFEKKEDASPVTVADQNAEKIIRKGLKDEFPDDGIIGEEFGSEEGSTGYNWIVDPIDGTKAFIAGVPLFGTMIGVEKDGKSRLGVVYIPGLDEMISASEGQGAWYERPHHDPIRAQVNKTPKLADGVMVTSQVSTFNKRNATQGFLELEERSFVTRTWGDCYGYMLVATGRAVCMIDPMMSIWDAAALQPIMEEAGGTFTSWTGESTIYSGDGIGTNGLVLEEILEVCRKYPMPQ